MTILIDVENIAGEFKLAGANRRIDADITAGSLEDLVQLLQQTLNTNEGVLLGVPAHTIELT